MSGEQFQMRVTVYLVRGGQPRPYADTEHVYDVTVEHKGYHSEAPHWRIEPMTHTVMIEDIALGVLRAPTARRDIQNEAYRERGFWMNYVDFVRHLDNNGQEIGAIPERSESGKVRVRIVEPYLD